MAKVKQIHRRVFKDLQSFWINYNKRFDRFEINLPEELEEYRELADLPPIQHKDSMEAVEKQLTEFIRYYCKNSVKKRKVILYRFETSSAKTTNLRYNSFDVKNLKLEFFWLVGEELSVGESRAITDPSATYPQEAQIKNYDQVIEWTEEREAFMVNFESKLRELIQTIERFEDKPKVLEALIDSGVRLLPGKG